MIVGSIQDGKAIKAFVQPALAAAIEYLRSTDFQSLDNGKVLIEGKEQSTASVMEVMTRPKLGTMAERHNRYIDIHYLLTGEETIGWSVCQKGIIPAQDRLLEEDTALYDQVLDEQDIHLTPGMYAIFFPHDLHRPGICRQDPKSIRKVVVKIDIETLGGNHYETIRS